MHIFDYQEGNQLVRSVVCSTSASAHAIYKKCSAMYNLFAQSKGFTGDPYCPTKRSVSALVYQYFRSNISQGHGQKVGKCGFMDRNKTHFEKGYSC